MVRTRRPRGAESDAHDVEVYATGSTIITGPDYERSEQPRSGADGLTPVGDQFRRAVTVLHDGLDHAHRFHAKSGPRMGPGPPAAASAREGTKSEIIWPVLLDPRRAWEFAGSGQLFAEPIPRLQVDQGPRPSRATYPVWTVSLRTGWVKRRAAQLQLSASPSFNVTVLELLPAAPRRTGTRSFLRAGLPAIEELARRLHASRSRHAGSA